MIEFEQRFAWFALAFAVFVLMLIAVKDLIKGE